MSEYKTKTVSGPIATFNDAIEGSDLANPGLNNIFHDAGDTKVTYYSESIDQVPQYFIKGTTLTSIANAIRTVKGTSDPIDVNDFIDEIDSMTLQLPAAEEVEF